MPVLATYKKWPVGSIVTPLPGPEPGKGEPAIAVSAPVAELILKTEFEPALFVETFATKRNFPFGLTTAAEGPLSPSANGDPAMAVNAPVVLLTENPEIVPSLKLGT